MNASLNTEAVSMMQKPTVFPLIFPCLVVFRCQVIVHRKLFSQQRIAERLKSQSHLNVFACHPKIITYRTFIPPAVWHGISTKFVYQSRWSIQNLIHQSKILNHQRTKKSAGQLRNGPIGTAGLLIAKFLHNIQAESILYLLPVTLCQ